MDRKDLERLRKSIGSYDEERENLIRQSRTVLRLSKVLIHSAQRQKLDAAKSSLDEVKKAKQFLDAIKQRKPGLSSEPSYSGACQEYAEAVLFYTFVKDGQIASSKAVGVSDSDYLLGMCDLTGELGRYAVAAAIRQDFLLVKKVHDTVSDIWEEFLKFNLRNSLLRKKSDSIKWNLQKIEDLIYDISNRKSNPR